MLMLCLIAFHFVVGIFGVVLRCFVLCLKNLNKSTLKLSFIQRFWYFYIFVFTFLVYCVVFLNKMEKIKITNKCQFEKLVEELEKNPSLARGFRRGIAPTNFKEEWESITTMLNSLGPPIRTGDGWQKIWRDLKFKVRRKIALNRAESKATGGGVFKQVILSPLEEAVANLLQFEKQIYPEGMVMGVPNADVSVDVYFLESLQSDSAPSISGNVAATTASAPSTLTASATATFTASAPSTTSAPSTSTKSAPSTICVPSTSTKSAPSTISVPSTTNNNRISSAPKKNPSNRDELLERHVTDQDRILTELSSSILSIKRSLRDVKDIQAKRLKLEVERSKREEERRIADMKIKRIELLIKEKELQLLN